MPAPDSFPPGAPVWVDLMTSDQERSFAFYGELFGWEVVELGPDYGGYANLSLDGHLVAGCMRSQEGGVPDVWSVYLATDDAERTVTDTRARGGGVLVEAMDVMALGRMAVVQDAGGAHVGVWQPGEHRGFEVLAEPGAPSWFELFTRDHPAAVAFYREVFGWDAHAVADTDEFRYTTLGEGEAQRAGIMDAKGFLPDGVPAHWSVYFAVADADATLAKVVALGGTVEDPAVDTPYGRLATAADATGARFKIQQAP